MADHLVRVDEATYARLKELAALEDRSLVALIRRAVKEYEKATKR